MCFERNYNLLISMNCKRIIMQTQTKPSNLKIPYFWCPLKHPGEYQLRLNGFSGNCSCRKCINERFRGHANLIHYNKDIKDQSVMRVLQNILHVPSKQFMQKTSPLRLLKEQFHKKGPYRHIQVWLDDQNEYWYDCSCGKITLSRDLTALKHHAHHHNENVKPCPRCERTFLHHWALNAHMKVHKAPRKRMKTNDDPLELSHR